MRGDLDEIPEVKAASEAFIALKDFQLDDEGNIADPDKMAVMMGREGSLVTTSGQVNPTLLVPAGGLRLRLLNASVSRFYRLQLEAHSMQLIATDGGALSAPVEVEELLLVPGERADVLIRGDRTPGSYRLLNLPYDRGGMGMMSGMKIGEGHSMKGMDMKMDNGPSMEGMDMDSSDPAASGEALPLATFTYSDSSQNEIAALPTQLMPTEPLPAAQNTRRIELSMRMSFLRGMAFTLNDKTYRADRTDIQVPLNTVEEWEIANVDADMMDHPFHLHAAPFQVVSQNGQPEAYPA